MRIKLRIQGVVKTSRLRLGAIAVGFCLAHTAAFTASNDNLQVSIYYKDPAVRHTTGDVIFLRDGRTLSVERDKIISPPALTSSRWNQIESLDHEDKSRPYFSLDLDVENRLVCFAGNCARVFAICPKKRLGSGKCWSFVTKEDLQSRSE